MNFSLPAMIFLAASATFASVGCKSSRTPADQGYPTTSSALEISTDPTILITQPTQWKSMTLYGIRIGDHQSVLPKVQTVEQLNAGWILMRNGNRYLSSNTDHIDALGVCEKRLIDQLNINTENDIAKVFNTKVTAIPADNGNTIHYLHDNHIRVVWSQLENRVAAVNVWK